MKNLTFDLCDSNKQKYNVKIDFSTYLLINATNEMTFPKKEYTCSIQLTTLQSYNNFRYNTIQDYYIPFSEFLKSNSFEIFTYNNYITLKINKPYYMQNDIFFSLNEKAFDITKIVNELCKKFLELEKKITSLENENVSGKNYYSFNSFFTRRLDNESERKYNELEKKYNNILNELNYIKSSLFLEEDKKILDNFFDYQKPSSYHLIYSSIKDGANRKNLLSCCKNKNNLLIFIIDSNGNKFGVYISSYLKDYEGSIVDYNSFLFSINKNKKFKTKEPENSIIVDPDYLICFGGKKGGNDLYLNFGNLASGMNKVQTFGDKNYDTTNNNSKFTIKSLDIYKIIF